MYTVGLLLDNLLASKETKIWKSIVQNASQKEINLVCFAGGSLDSPYYYHAQRNSIYDLVSSQRIDGLIAISDSLGNNVSGEKLSRFISGFSGIPIVSIGIPFPGIPSVCTDNETGMRDLVSHCVQKHNRTKIAFIIGPAENAHVQSHLNAYKKALSDLNLPFRDELIVACDFSIEEGVEAVQILLDERKAGFDAFIASNDNIAIAAMRELSARGIKIPEQVSVFSIDGIEEAPGSTSSLTTVQQPLNRIGRRALDMLMGLLESGQNPGNEIIAPSLLVRRSCGCGEIESNLHNDMLSSRMESPPAQYSISELLHSSNYDEINTILKQLFNQFEILQARIALYTDETRSHSKVLLAMNDGEQVHNQSDSNSDSKSILTEFLKLPGHNKSLIVLPLYIKREDLGFAVFEITTPDGTVYEMIASILSGALKNAQMHECYSDDSKEGSGLGKSGKRVRPIAADDELSPEKRVVLIVDDDRSFAGKIEGELSKKYIMFSALNGRDALEKIDQIPVPDIIIARAILPDMSGLVLIRTLFDFEEYKHIPFIFISNKNTFDERIEGLKEGAIDFINEPFSITEICTKIDSIILNHSRLKNMYTRMIGNRIITSLDEGEGSTYRTEEYLQLDMISSKYRISSREKEVILLLAQGLLNKEISDRLKISIKTLDSHIHNIYKKMSIQNKVELINLLKS
jgi:DNA-binding LacI/PurR family transcriptional regulator/DNA-binding NarL/FixJ family response regulator